MKADIKVPEMGESVFEATIGQILVTQGSYVQSGEEILELETDKVNQVVYAPQSGAVELSVKEGDAVRVGDVIGTIDTDAEVQKPSEPSPPAPEKKEAAPAPSSSAPSCEGARKTPDDFLQDMQKSPAPLSKAPSPAPENVQRSEEPGVVRTRMSRLRATIASRLVEVKNQTAMLTTFNEIDMSAVMEIRKKEQDGFVKTHGIKLGFMSFFVKAAVAALKEFPILNSFIEGEEILTLSSYDIGVAVSTEKGLFVPVVRECEEKSYAEVEKAIADYATKAREGSISIDDLKGGSFTITNGGVFGSLFSTPILNPPQSAILGMHSIVKRPIAVDDAVVIRPMMYVALSYDHRLVDGREAVQFLGHIKASLEDPTRMLLDV